MIRQTPSSTQTATLFPYTTLCLSVVDSSTCLYRPRANIMRLHSFVFGLVVVALSAAFLWVISPYAGAVLWGVIFAIMFIGMKERLSARFGGRDGQIGRAHV